MRKQLPKQRRWFLSMHAIRRVREMGLTRADVIEVLEDAEVLRQTRGGNLASRGPIAVCWADDVVITVLWHTAERTADRNPTHLVTRAS